MEKEIICPKCNRVYKRDWYALKRVVDHKRDIIYMNCPVDQEFIIVTERQIGEVKELIVFETFVEHVEEGFPNEHNIFRVTGSVNGDYTNLLVLNDLDEPFSMRSIENGRFEDFVFTVDLEDENFASRTVGFQLEDGLTGEKSEVFRYPLPITE